MFLKRICCFVNINMIKCVAYNIFCEGGISTRKSTGHYCKFILTLIDQLMNRELNELGLTSAQGNVMGYLTHTSEAPCARDLEGFFQLSHPTVSGLLSRMEAKGFIEIRPDPDDRRVKRIYPLEKGMSCSKRIEECVQDIETQLVYGFSDEEKAVFLDLLQRAANNLNQKVQESPFATRGVKNE